MKHGASNDIIDVCHWVANIVQVPISSFLSEKIFAVSCPADAVVLEMEEVRLEVEGKIPEWLDGTFMRNGAGTFKGMKHMFDGFALLAKFSISGCHASFSCR